MRTIAPINFRGDAIGPKGSPSPGRRGARQGSASRERRHGAGRRPDLDQERLVRRLHARRDRRQAAGPQRLRRTDGLLSRRRRRVAALEDFCPHRGAPLSLGLGGDGKLVCGYHGLEMGCDGRAVAMPGQRVRGFPPIRAYPGGRAPRLHLGLAGRCGPGRSGQAAHLAWAESPDWAYGGGLYPRALRLPADDRQPDGPDPRDLCPRHAASARRRSTRRRSDQARRRQW